MIPPQRATMVPALEILRNGNLRARDLADMLAARFGLTDEERSRKVSSGGYVFDIKVRFALYDLKRAGLLALENGKYSITDAGGKALDGKRDLAQMISRSRRKGNRKRRATGGRKRTAGGRTEPGTTPEGRSLVPSRQEIAAPIMKMLRDGSGVHSGDLTGELARRFALTDEARNMRHQSGHCMFGNRVRWALYDLKHAGLLGLKDTKYSITEGGKSLADQNPDMDAESLAAAVKRLEKGAPLEEVIRSFKGGKGNPRRGPEETEAILHHKKLMPQVLEICRNGQDFRIKGMSEKLAARLGLTRRESSQKLPGGHNLLYNRTYLAILYLTRAGLLDHKKPLYSITEAGRVILDRNYDQKTGRLSEDLADQILAIYRKRTGRKGTGRRKGPAGRPKRPKSRRTAKPRKEPPGGQGRKGTPGAIQPPPIPPQSKPPKSLDRMGVPGTEDRLNEFKEFYQYDADIERLPAGMPAGARESAIRGIKRRVQARFAAAVCAFGNADGGTVYLGVKSDGTISGLEKGRELGGFENYTDAFANNIETRLEDLIKDVVFVIRNVKIDFVQIDGRTICRVRIEPSTVPLYLHVNGEQQFWVRGSSPRSIKLAGMEQARYIKEHFDRSVP